MRARWFVIPVFALQAVLLAGCSPDSVREHTADLTAMAKRNAGAVVKGVFEGLMRKGPTNINNASAKDLQALPDVTPQQAQAIIAGRPYDNTNQLVKKQIMSQSQYNKLRAQMIIK
jgi:Helix-hairpin-helix motif